MPTIASATALKGFWQTISMKALYNAWADETEQALLTMTEGILQATFSSLGRTVSWKFIQDFALEAAEAVQQGWTDTFDAYYVEKMTGVTVWVSFRVLRVVPASKLKGS